MAYNIFDFYNNYNEYLNSEFYCIELWSIELLLILLLLSLC